ncbi:hypothetical protein WME89_04670 [Sorangium sp. So ce321]
MTSIVSMAANNDLRDQDVRAVLAGVATLVSTWTQLPDIAQQCPGRG